MQSNIGDATAAAVERIELCFSGPDCDWAQFYQPKDESMAMASRYQLVYPALSYFVELNRNPGQADKIRPRLDTIYRGLLEQRCWGKWPGQIDCGGISRQNSGQGLMSILISQDFSFWANAWKKAPFIN